MDNKTQLKLDGDNLNIQAVTNQIGAYTFGVDCINASGKLENIVLGGNIVKDTRIKIDPFVSTDANGVEYNALTTRTDEDNFIQEKLGLNNGNNIPPSKIPPYNCANYSFQLFVDSKNLGEKMRTISSDFGKYWLYNNYAGNNIDSIYKNGGTLEEMGTIGAPIIMTILVDTSYYSSYFGHSMNAVATGKDIRKWEDWNFIEPSTDQTKLQIGQEKILRNCDKVIITYPYLVEDKFNGNSLKFIDLVKFRIEDGNPILIWENNDPNYNIVKQRGK